jgi:hypothetical protein
MAGATTDAWDPDLLPARWDELRSRLEAISEGAAARGIDADGELELERVLRNQRDAAAAYVASLTDVVVGRCPFTSLAVVRSVDTRTLAGPWWDHRAPLRRTRHDPATLFALTGALALNGHPEPSQHLVAPGPAVPHVVPRLLARPDAIAVLSSFAVGSHRAYVTTYYARPGSTDLPVANEWPHGAWTGRDGWQSIDEPEDVDSDVGAWLDRDQLLWIDGEDPTAKLHAGRDGCPYLELAGTRTPQRIQHGIVW